MPPLAASVNTDFRGQYGNRLQRLQLIAEAGFKQVHWCQHWNDDYFYRPRDMEKVRRQLQSVSLAVADLHASSGKKHRWTSPDETSRLPGVELVRNRIQLAGELGASTIVLHMEAESDDEFGGPSYLDRIDRAVISLRPDLMRCNVRIAIENIFLPVANFNVMETVFNRTDPALVGFCYDSGHGQITGGGVEFLSRNRSRLIALHLHDNDGQHDRHRLPGDGIVDWPAVLRIIADSPYQGPVTLEMFQADQCGGNAANFLREVKRIADDFSGKIQELRTAPLCE